MHLIYEKSSSGEEKIISHYLQPENFIEALKDILTHILKIEYTIIDTPDSVCVYKDCFRIHTSNGHYLVKENENTYSLVEKFEEVSLGLLWNGVKQTIRTKFTWKLLSLQIPIISYTEEEIVEEKIEVDNTDIGLGEIIQDLTLNEITEKY